jgi:hypothetical protein
VCNFCRNDASQRSGWMSSRARMFPGAPTPSGAPVPSPGSFLSASNHPVAPLSHTDRFDPPIASSSLTASITYVAPSTGPPSSRRAASLSRSSTT